MRVGSLYSGIGGELLAALWMKWQNVFWVEKDDWCRAHLRRRFSNVKGYSRVEWFEGKEYEGRIDIVSGGFPCKQTSIGSEISKTRKGLTGKDSGLWVHQIRIFEEIKAPWVVIENPPGVEKWEEEIKSRLAGIGYTVSRLEITANSVGLPHKRKRYFYVGNANGKRLEGSWLTGSPTTEWVERLTASGGTWLQSSPGTDRGFNGLSNRVDRIKALGNSNPPIMYMEIFKAIEQANTNP